MSYRWIRRRIALVVAGVTIASLALAGVAWAYWSAQAASVPAYSQADTMGAGGRPSAGVSGSTATVSWAAATTAGGHAVGGYLVNRYATASGGTGIAAAAGSCAAAPVTTTSCAETNVPAGTWYYTVTPVLGNWRGAESPRAVGVSVGVSFALSLPGGTTTLTAGAATTLTLTATAGGQTDAGYTGARTLVFGGPGTSPNGTSPAYNGGSSSVTFTGGVASLPMTLYRAESTTLAVTAADAAGGLALVVRPAAASAFGVAPPSTATAGVAQTVAVTAQDGYGNVVTTYAGGKILAWSGPGNAPGGQQPVYPANPVTFTSGAANVSVTLYAAQTTSLAVSDGSISGTSAPFTVVGGTVTRFALAQPGTQAAGVAFTVTVTALDAYGNNASYTGGNLTFSGPGTAPDGSAPSYPANPVAFGDGTATVSMTLVRAESVTLAVSSGTVTGQTSGKVTVTPGGARNLAWTSAAVSSGATLGSACLFTCTATGMNGKTFSASVSVTDAHGNIVSGIGAQSITVSVGPSGGTLGSFTAPTSGSSVTLSTPASGAATSNPLTFSAPSGQWSPNTLTATDGSYGTATATISR
jgi:hypothetical protein